MELNPGYGDGAKMYNLGDCESFLGENIGYANVSDSSNNGSTITSIVSLNPPPPPPHIHTYVFTRGIALGEWDGQSSFGHFR